MAVVTETMKFKLFQTSLRHERSSQALPFPYYLIKKALLCKYQVLWIWQVRAVARELNNVGIHGSSSLNQSSAVAV